MANTIAADDVAIWIRKEWMPKQIGGSFKCGDIRLLTGGLHRFSAVSQNQSIIACISTNRTRLPSGKSATDRLYKVRSDLYYLLLTGENNRKLYLCTEQDMKDWGDAEKRKGLIPGNVEFHLVSLPTSLRVNLEASRRATSHELVPGSG